MQINKEISTELRRRGFHGSSSSTRKIVSEFEKNVIADRIFDYLKTNGYMRIIFQAIAEEIPLTVDEAHNILVRDKMLEKILSTSPSRNLICRNCRAIVSSYNPFRSRKPWRKETCSHCHLTTSLRECRDVDDWKLTNVQIRDILNEFVSEQMLTRRMIRFCSNCVIHKDRRTIAFDEISSMEKKELEKCIKTFYCEKCFDLLDTYKMFTLDQVASLIFSQDGIWFEWYVKNLIKESNRDIAIEQGLNVHNDIGIEVDVLALKDGKLICFECKASRPSKSLKIGDIANVIQMRDFADRIFLITTGKITNRAEKLLTKQSITVLQGEAIEDVGRVL